LVLSFQRKNQVWAEPKVLIKSFEKPLKIIESWHIIDTVKFKKEAFFLEKFFSDNRKNINKIIDKKSILVLFAGAAPTKRGDEKYPFTPDRNFYYCTGLDNEKLIYMSYKDNKETKEYLFIERTNPTEAKWTGEVIGKDEAKEKSGISDFKYIDEFESFFSNIVFSKRIENVYLDLENREMSANTPSFKFSKKIQENYPYISIKNCYSHLSELRRIKHPFEIDKIKKAINITKDGILLMMRNSKAGMYEYEIEAYFDFAIKSEGANDFAFKSIAASGKNSTILHYSKNNSKTKENDLILFDVGAQFEYYNSDITRTFPLNGKFTERQKVIYNIVLKGQKKVIESIKPGLPFKQLNNILKEFYFIELKKIDLISKDGTIDDVSKYYYHNVSHLLGLETHDAGRHNEGILEEGMVFTVEPGLYIEEEEIGIRIEDNILVTKDGCEILSKDIIKEIDDIEEYMLSNKGNLS